MQNTKYKQMEHLVCGGNPYGELKKTNINKKTEKSEAVSALGFEVCES